MFQKRFIGECQRTVGFDGENILRNGIDSLPQHLDARLSGNQIRNILHITFPQIASVGRPATDRLDPQHHIPVLVMHHILDTLLPTAGVQPPDIFLDLFHVRHRHPRKIFGHIHLPVFARLEHRIGIPLRFEPLLFRIVLPHADPGEPFQIFHLLFLLPQQSLVLIDIIGNIPQPDHSVEVVVSAHRNHIINGQFPRFPRTFVKIFAKSFPSAPQG